MNGYLKVRCAGFITYCDAIIARKNADNQFHAVFLSLIGTPSHIKATSAILYQGNSCHIIDRDNPPAELSFMVDPCTYRTRKINETINKVMVSSGYFSIKKETPKAAVIYGQNIAVVQERAFLRLNAGTTIPLKPEWQEWLWEEILQPEKFYSFGGEELREAYIVSWPEDEKLQKNVLEGISLGYLT